MFIVHVLLLAKHPVFGAVENLNCGVMDYESM
jgi:hypothetical protein